MRCILAENPSVALDIARTLGTPQKQDGYVTVGSDTITWAYGHLATLASPEQYDPAWKTWAWATLPMLPTRFQLAPIAKTTPHLHKVLALLRQADRIVCATDADREGELIFRYIYALAGVQKPVDRLWLSENTATAIRTALGAMKPATAYNALAQAAQARAQADWLIGLNATRAVSLRHGEPGQPLSVGRVQTPTLKLIVDRDLAIAAFQPVPYWQVRVLFQAAAGEYSGIWHGTAREHPHWIATAAQAQALAAQLPPGTPGRIERIDTKTVTIAPPLFFNLNDLQKEANRRLGLTAQQTLDAVQSLYDQHLTSYPRTEARVITPDVAKTVAGRLRGLTIGTPALMAESQATLRQRLPRVVNAAAVAQAGHYAIIPTGQVPPASLSLRDQAVYDLIARRFLAALLPPGQDARTTLWTQAAGARFKTTGTVVLTPGWRAALTPEDTGSGKNGQSGSLGETEDTGDNDTNGEHGKNPDEAADQESAAVLPPGLQPGDPVSVVDTTVDAKKTPPPSRFTDAGLLTLMEKYGLGTPATRARILEVLLARDYVRREKKRLISTDKARQLLQVLPETLQSPDLTRAWETRLEAIAQGSEDPRHFLTDIRQLTQEVVDTTRQHPAGTMAPSVTDWGPCPVCHQGQIRENAKGWGCSRWKEGCRFMIWKTIAGKRLTATQVKTLLAGKPTGVLKGFQSKAGKAFDAQLTLDGDRIAFVFAPRP